MADFSDKSCAFYFSLKAQKNTEGKKLTLFIE